MKKSKKKIPTTHLKKYDTGGRATSATGRSAQNAQADPASNGNINYMNDQRTKGLSTAQYAQLGNSYFSDNRSNSQKGQDISMAVGAGATMIGDAYNDPNATDRQKSEAISSGVTGTIGAINPAIGGIIGVGDAIGKPIRTGLEKTDPNTGKLVDRSGAKVGAVVGSFFDPTKMLGEAINGNWDITGNKYADNLEKEALDQINAQKASQAAYDQQLQAQQAQQAQYNLMYQDYQNRNKQFAQGGMNMVPNAEVESQENSVAPNGQFTQFNGPSHANGGIKTQLEPGEMVFSDRLKLGKKTFAELNKSNNTNKEDKILEDAKSGNISTRTAALMKMAKLKSSQELFNTQEALKQAKVEAYAKKMGVTLPQPQEALEGNIQFANGGSVNVNKNTYQYPVIPNNQFDGNKFYNPNTNFVSNVPTQYSYNNVNNTNNSMFPDSNVVNPYRERTQVYKNGGMNLPKYPNGIKYKGKSEDRKTFLENKINNELSTPNYQYYDKTDYKNIPQSSYAPGVLGYNNSLNSPQNPYVKPVDNTDYQKINQDSYDEDLKKGLEDSNVSSDSPSWKNVTGQVGMGLLQNAGNIYNLSRYNTPEIEKYERVKASYLDPTAAIRDAEQENRRAEVDIRNATSGNAGNYLSNRVALSTKNALNKDRVRQQYANTNAGIANQNSQVNADISMREIITNAQNRARTRSGKEEAISQIGSNIANQFLDPKKGKMDKSMMEMLPKMLNNPEFQKFYEEWSKKNG